MDANEQNNGQQTTAEQVQTGESQAGESELTMEQVLELPDDTLKQYGIDDPKLWKNYQRALHKEQQKRTDEKKSYEDKLRGYDAKLSQLERELVSVKNPQAKVEVIQEPTPPSDPDDPLEQLKYQRALRDYDRKVTEQKFKKVEELEKVIKQQTELARQKEQVEMARSYYIGALVNEAKIAPDIAASVYDEFIDLPNKTPREIVPLLADFAKYRTTKQPTKKVDTGETFKFKMPAAASGGTGGEVVDPGQFTKSKNTTDLYRKQG